MVSMANKRRDRDVMRLMATGYNVTLQDENKMNEIVVDFPGPEESPYVGVSFVSIIHSVYRSEAHQILLL